MGGNGRKRVETGGKGQKWTEMEENRLKQAEMCIKGRKRPETGGNGQKQAKRANGWKRVKMV